jgi:hypothetical protein
LQEFAEATAEEAGKKFKDLNLGSTIASSTSPTPSVRNQNNSLFHIFQTLPSPIFSN